MKILTILGTRPEIIRLSRVIPALDASCEHLLVHTGQNYDPKLSTCFFDAMSVRAPDHYMGISEPTAMERVGRVLAETERILTKERPDRLLILGDTDSALSAYVAKRMGIPVYHMEAGNRCYDDRVPEEVNRRIIDHSSDVLMPYTERSRQNLLAEGIPGSRIFVTGNPIFEVLNHFEKEIAASTIVDALELKSKHYFLVTIHRAENVDLESRLKDLVTAFDDLAEAYGKRIIVSTHPRTKKRMTEFSCAPKNPLITFLEPFGFFDFVKLEKDAFCVLSDSGTVQEECAILGVPNVTLRDATERPETLECGSNTLSGVSPTQIALSVKTVLNQPSDWRPPAEYLEKSVSRVVTKILLGYRH